MEIYIVSIQLIKYVDHEEHIIKEVTTIETPDLEEATTEFEHVVNKVYGD